MRWADRYDGIFCWSGQKYQVPWRLLKSQAFAESGFDPDAKSSGGAFGLMQFTKMAAQDYFKGHQRDVYDPEEAIEAAASYDAKLYFGAKALLHGLSDDDVFLWRVAVAGYNCGPGYTRAALKIMMAEGKPMDWESFSEVLPRAECQGKVADVKETLPYAVKVVPDASVLQGGLPSWTTT
jgi:membrane-bound lytic murein transglycosylase MltF